MGEKKQVVREYVAQGLALNACLEIMGITDNQYYGKKKLGTAKVGRPNTTHTHQYTDEHTIVEVEDQQVVKDIEKVLEDEDTQYGYKRMTAAMMLLGYMIGSKKILRLMKENGLLQARRRPSGKIRVRGRKVQANGPLEVLSMDIKQVWVEEYARSAYILTILDTFTRTALYKSVGYQMTQHQVHQAWRYVIVHYLQPADLIHRGLKVEIRNDNGPQFAARLVREFLLKNGLDQVFTYPYCPQQNGHIESFHAILSEHLERFHFQTLSELEKNLELFYDKYNCVRLHGSIACLPPLLFWQLWEKGAIKMYQTTRNKTKFKVLMPFWKLSGNGILREFPILKHQEARSASPHTKMAV